MLELIRNLPAIRKAITSYDQLPQREQRALGLMDAALVLFTLYLGVWRPTYEYRLKSERDLDSARQTLAWMQSHSEEARSLASRSQASPGATDGRSLLALVTSSAKDSGINLQRFEPSGENGMRVWLDKVSFKAVAGWLEKLSVEHGIRVDQASMERTPEPGQVNVRLTLQI